MPLVKFCTKVPIVALENHKRCASALVAHVKIHFMANVLAGESLRFEFYSRRFSKGL